MCNDNFKNRGNLELLWKQNFFLKFFALKFVEDRMLVDFRSKCFFFFFFARSSVVIEKLWRWWFAFEIQA